MKIQIQDQTIDLLPDACALLSDGTLVVADLHLGKATAFQAKGLAIPEGDSEADLRRLKDLCKWHEATRLVINGDLFHSPAGMNPEIERLLETFLNDMQIPIELTLGNHERKIPHIPPALSPTEFVEHAGFHIVHDPADAPKGVPTVTAHWHPVVKIADSKRTSLRLPCFLVRRNMVVLPSFGSFTGGQIIDPEDGDRFLVSPGEDVVEVPGELIRG
jgi:DNA ligase-associated metallophosphoesterase